MTLTSHRTQNFTAVGDGDDTGSDRDDRDQDPNYNTSHELPSSPTPAAYINRPIEDSSTPIPAPSNSNLPKVSPKPAPPPGNTFRNNTLHAFFNIPHQSTPPTTGRAPSTLKHKKSLGEEMKSPPLKKHKPPGTSKSAQYEAQARAAANNGDPIDPDKFSRFKDKILKLDPHADFLIGGDICAVRHSKCGGVKKQKTSYNTSYFVNHVVKCQGPSKKNAHTINVDRSVLTNFLQRPCPPADPNPPAHADSVARHCPGLTPELNPKISVYLVRSQAAGGGARPRRDIVHQLFGEEKKWGDLNERQWLRVSGPSR